MVHVSATEAKTHFGKLLDTARREEVVIEKQGRSVAVIISQEEFERLSAFENAFWVIKANMAKDEGYLSLEESENLLNELLSA